MNKKSKSKELTLLKVDSETKELVPFHSGSLIGDDDDEGSGSGSWEDTSTRVKFEDPFKNHELLEELAKRHQNFAESVQRSVEPPEQSKQSDLSNNFGMENKSEFLPHPLLAGKPYFNGADPKVTVLPSETELTDSPEFNNAKNELQLRKQLRNEKKMQNQKQKGFNPRPDGM